MLPAGATLNYKLVGAANAVQGIQFLMIWGVFSGFGMLFYRSIHGVWLSGASSQIIGATMRPHQAVGGGWRKT